MKYKIRYLQGYDITKEDTVVVDCINLTDLIGKILSIKDSACYHDHRLSISVIDEDGNIVYEDTGTLLEDIVRKAYNRMISE